MPTIIEQDAQPVSQGPGWNEVLIAADQLAGEPISMTAVRYRLEAGGHSRAVAPADEERFLYVVSGSGSALVGEERFELEAESVLWLDPQDPELVLEGGPAGLDAILASAPASNDPKT